MVDSAEIVAEQVHPLSIQRSIIIALFGSISTHFTAHSRHNICNLPSRCLSMVSSSTNVLALSLLLTQSKGYRTDTHSIDYFWTIGSSHLPHLYDSSGFWFVELEFRFKKNFTQLLIYCSRYFDFGNIIGLFYFVFITLFICIIILLFITIIQIDFNNCWHIFMIECYSIGNNMDSLLMESSTW